jgi:hypothetical protein
VLSVPDVSLRVVAGWGTVIGAAAGAEVVNG